MRLFPLLATLAIMNGVESQAQPLSATESLYLNLHSKDYVRIQADSRFILNFATYLDDTRTMMRRYQDSGRKLSMEVRFEERITNGNFSSERGISKVVFSGPERIERIFYGRFHTILRQEGGIWKKLTDYAPAAQNIQEADFRQARDMEDVEPFACYMTYPEKKPYCGK